MVADTSAFAAGEANDGFIIVERRVVGTAAADAAVDGTYVAELLGEVIVVVEAGNGTMLLCFSACTKPGRSVNKQQKSIEV